MKIDNKSVERGNCSNIWEKAKLIKIPFMKKLKRD